MSSQNLKNQMQGVIAALGEELRTLRPGRASGDLVGTLPVAVYGQSMPISQLAAISANDQSQLMVQPWDKSSMGAIETAIRDSQLGFSVINEGTQLRLSLPPLSQERRQEFVKLTHQKGEAARIRLRQLRAESLQEASRAKASGQLREDDLNRLTKEANELIDDFNQQVKTLTEVKEKELLTV